LVDTNRNYIAHRVSLPPVYDKIQLNHYFTKSYEDWCDRFDRGDLAPNHRKWEAFFEQNPTMKNIAHYKYELSRKKYKDFKSDDLISVVMCTYNRAKFLDNVISNILNQTYTNLEFVIVDDGSTDNSKEILEEWKKKDSRVRVIYSDHNFCKSRNLAFKEAKGAYVACMDSDDECALDRLEKQYLYLKAHQDVDIVGT
jgi:cellulose synthase/poly-beta-1,6-N-acetylglucosamine synthase-like glycosyltransferase